MTSNPFKGISPEIDKMIDDLPDNPEQSVDSNLHESVGIGSVDEELVAVDVAEAYLWDLAANKGDWNEFMATLRTYVKSHTQQMVLEARIDEVKEMHHAYEVNLSADIDFDPTVYKVHRIDHLDELLLESQLKSKEEV